MAQQKALHWDDGWLIGGPQHWRTRYHSHGVQQMLWALLCIGNAYGSCHECRRAPCWVAASFHNGTYALCVESCRLGWEGGCVHGLLCPELCSGWCTTPWCWHWSHRCSAPGILRTRRMRPCVAAVGAQCFDVRTAIREPLAMTNGTVLKVRHHGRQALCHSCQAHTCGSALLMLCCASICRLACGHVH